MCTVLLPPGVNMTAVKYNNCRIKRTTSGIKTSVELLEKSVLTTSADVISINRLTPELKPSAQRFLTRILLGILLLEPSSSLIYA
jgi:hypothetical protein